MNDIENINEITVLLKENNFPMWGKAIPLDRRDISLYVKQLIDRYKEVEIINGLEEAVKEIKEEITSLEDDRDELGEEIKEEITSLEEDRDELGEEVEGFAMMTREIRHILGEI